MSYSLRLSRLSLNEAIENRKTAIRIADDSRKVSDAVSDATGKQLESQATSLKEVAAAAIKSSQTSERALEVSQRAYLAFTRFKLDPSIGGKLPDVKYSILNTGQTPALLVELREGFWMGPKVSEWPKPGTMKVVRVQKMHEIRIPRAGVHNMTFSFQSLRNELSIPAWDKIQNGVLSFLLCFKCIYKDIFGKNYPECSLVFYDDTKRELSVSYDAECSCEEEKKPDRQP